MLACLHFVHHYFRFANTMQSQPVRFQGSAWNDVLWGLIWIVQFLGTIAGGAYGLYYNWEQVTQDGRAQTNLTPVQAGRWLAICIGLATLDVVSILVLLKMFTRRFIIGANVLFLGLLVTASVVSFLYSSMVSGIVLIVFSVLYMFWFRSIQDRIPFATVMLRTATCITATYPAMTITAFFALLLSIMYYMFFFALMLMFKVCIVPWLVVVHIVVVVDEAITSSVHPDPGAG